MSSRHWRPGRAQARALPSPGLTFRELISGCTESPHSPWGDVSGVEKRPLLTYWSLCGRPGEQNTRHRETTCRGEQAHSGRGFPSGTWKGWWGQAHEPRRLPVPRRDSDWLTGEGQKGRKRQWLPGRLKTWPNAHVKARWLISSDVLSTPQGCGSGVPGRAGSSPERRSFGKGQQ